MEMSSIEFIVRPGLESDRVEAVVPVIDGTDLITLVTAFEHARSFDVVGGYDGIIPANYRFGPLLDHFLGSDQSAWPGGGKIAVLGCACGEVGCWPIFTSVTATPARIRWEDFEQPYRADRDYRAFGPFDFDRNEYERAVADAVAVLPPAPN